MQDEKRVNQDAPKGESRAINVEQPNIGGRHCRTESYGRKAFDDELPRDALARDTWDLRRIFSERKLEMHLENILQNTKNHTQRYLRNQKNEFGFRGEVSKNSASSIQ
jgi:hypothetical protein